MRDHNELEAQDAAQSDVLAKASTLEVQFQNARENSPVRMNMIARFEAEILKIKVEVVDARTEAEVV